MIEFIQNFHFLRPWVLLFLLLPIGLFWRKIGGGKNVSSWEDVCDPNLLEYLLIKTDKQKKISYMHFVYVGLLSAIIAAAGPAWKKTEVPTIEVENPSLFVLSLSQDMQLKDVTPSRLERAKFFISDIADELHEGQFGLAVYSREPYIITPLTNDIKIIKNLLPQIVPSIVPDKGDRLDRALDMAINKFKAAEYVSGNIILLASDVGQRFDYALEKAEQATKQHFSVNVIDMSYSENEKMKMLAEKGNGLYLHAKKETPQKIIQKLQQIKQEKITLSKNLRSDYLDYGYYLIFISLLCFLPFFRRGILSILLCFMFITPAYAGFFTNNDQDGFSLFQKGLYEQALQKFNNALWKGICLYKLDKKEEALMEFSKIKNDASLYNKGVVLTKMCQYEKALSAFDEAIKINPQHANALYNKKILLDLFEKAKSDPSVLNCDDQQNQKQNQKQQNKENQNEQHQNNSSENDENNAQDNNENSDSTASSQDNNSQQQNNKKNSKDASQTPDNHQSNAQHTQSSKDYEESNNNEQQHSPNESAKTEGEQQKNQNKNSSDDSGSEPQNKDTAVQPVNAQKGDDNADYDEEALALQRRYREIPEDVGGLIREFIKKEYMKDRYRDEKD
ncbi:MAG: VWA domain-containing protein [Alphaproteobacteria bacterium]|nr:VWA domain-containing protein [Alphaproteobacteria bacterium]